MKVLIISLNFHTAEGSIAKGIAGALQDHEIYFFSIAEVKYRSQELDELIKHVDVVHWLFNVGHLNETKGKYFNIHQTPTIATVHHVCKEEEYKITAAAKADLIHVVSSEWITPIQQKCDVEIHLAHLGIDPDDFHPINILPYTSGPFKIGMIGFFPGARNRKRMDIAMAVFKKLAERNCNFEVELQGDGWDKHLDFFAKHHITVNYSKLTRTANIFDFYGKVHVLLCSSDYEGGPLPVLEALNFGLPVVSTEVGIALDALSKGGGILAPKGDAELLANALQKLMTTPTLYEKLQSETKPVAQQFHWTSLANEYTELYKIGAAKRINPLSAQSKLPYTPSKQRHNELVLDRIHEGQLLVQKGQIKQAALVFMKPLFSNIVPLSRKIGMLKYLVNGLLKRY